MTHFRCFALALVLSTLSQPGCGGKAVDDQSGGDGDGDAPGGPVDPLSDEGFPDAVEDRFDEYCENLEGCNGVLDRATCEAAQDQLSLAYDTESRECRSLLLESFDCMNETWRNCTGGFECSDVARELNERCAQF